LIYEDNKVTKVLKVDTGEVLLFKTYKMEKKETKEEWVLFMTTDHGYWYYDKSSLINLNNKYIRVWNKLKYSKVQKEKEIKLLKELNGYKPQYGWENLDYGMTLYELDCLNNTDKLIRVIKYNNEGKILLDIDVPDTDQHIDHIIPGSNIEGLIIKVCPNR
jgi:hypothetical protein